MAPPPQDPPKDPSIRGKARIPFQEKISIEFEKFSGFVTEYSANISEGGMFIVTKDPKPPGTVVSFEFRLKDNFRLVAGLGDVTWIRAQDEGPGKPKGMGVRFHEIDEESRELIRTMVTQHVARGGKMFDVNEKPAGASTAAPSPPPPSAPASPMEPKGPRVEEEFGALFAENSSTGGGPKGIESIDLGEVPEPTLPPETFPSMTPDRPTATRPDPTFAEPKKRSFPTSKLLALVAGLAVAAGLWFIFKTWVPELFHSDRPQQKVAVKSDTPAPPPTSSAPPTTAAPATAASAPPATSATASPPATSATAVAASRKESPTQAPTVSPKAAAATAPETTPAESASTPEQPTLSISQITWIPQGNDTIVTIHANQPIPPGAISHQRIVHPAPRELIKIAGVQWIRWEPTIPVSTPQLQRIRLGYHQKSHELHIVLDLPDSQSFLRKQESVGNKLLLHIRRR